MSPIVFASVDGWRVKIDGPVVIRLRSFAQTGRDDLEAGGILLGREIIGSGDYVVDGLTEPMSDDRRRRRSFFRTIRLHQQKVSKVWHDSGGTRNYLGEWHTHPESCPSPSSIDLQDWRLRIRQPGLQTRFVVFLIVGTKEMVAWVGNCRQQALDRLGRRNLSS